MIAPSEQVEPPSEHPAKPPEHVGTVGTSEQERRGRSALPEYTLPADAVCCHVDAALEWASSPSSVVQRLRALRAEQEKIRTPAAS
jgi:hypothetical protein